MVSQPGGYRNLSDGRHRAAAVFLLLSAAMFTDTEVLAPPPAAAGEGWQVIAADSDTGHWHAHARSLLFYWRNRCHDGRLPARDMINPADLRGILPYMWMLDIQPEPWRFLYRLAGTRFVAALGLEVTRRWYDEARPLAWAANRNRLITVARDALPTWRRGRMPLETGDWREVENLMLPLAADGRHPDIILGISIPYRSDGRLAV